MQPIPRYILLLAVAGLIAGAALAGDGLVKLTPADASCPDSSGDRFVDCGNGTITDNTTGLVWLQNAHCWNLGPHPNYQVSMATAEGLGDGLCGLTDGSEPGDWRLPSKADWEAMIAGVDIACDPRIADDSGLGCWMEGLDLFTNVQSDRYWSASTEDGEVNRAWFVNLTTGVIETGNKDGQLLLWPVRSAQ